jgi:hypothetical protein
MDMPIDDVAISYDIKFEKDHASVKVTYGLSVPVGGPALIANFQVTVDGTDLISGFLPGQTAFNGAKFHILSNPSKDAPVSFTLSSNQGGLRATMTYYAARKITTRRNFPTKRSTQDTRATVGSTACGATASA